jgi:hypothetical protein
MIPEINPLPWITGAPIAFGMILLAAIVGVIYGIRIYSYRKSPTPYRVADYLMAMPHTRQIWKMTIFELDFVVDAAFIESLKELDKTGQLARVFEANKDNMHFYIGRHMSAEATTKDSGMSLIMTDAPLDHSDYYIPLQEHMNWLKGIETHLRRVSDSGDDGIWIPNTDKHLNNEQLDFIYYTLKPFTKNPTIAPKKLEMVEATMAAVAGAKQMVLTQRHSKQNKIDRDAAISAKEAAESELKKVKEENNFLRRQWSKKDYWASSLSTLGSPLSMMVVIGIVGACAVLLPDMIQRQLPGYTPQHYIGFAVAIGAGITWLVSTFRK